MTYLFDTDVISHLARPAPRAALMRRVAATPQNQQATSSITVGELHYGAHRAVDHTALLLGRIETLLANLGVIPFDRRSATIYGELRAELERRGTPIGDADTRIASIALAHGLIVVTGNMRHFERVPGLVVENWLVE